MDKDAFFWQTQDGRLPTPPAAATLGIDIAAVDPVAGTLEASFEALPSFCNPMGNIQGGSLAAMLDDTMGPTLAATLAAREFAPTLNLNVQFMAPARPGSLQSKGRITKRGRDICYLAADLFQGDRLVACATATAVIRKTGA
jgi:uncharacterized protein (TIGR00369 family)